ncbi:hypothetical protein [Pirellula sp. SH-Sr6A]|uniref:hypothetical protein n=1 Tax=Pirellula sp. SH-Sr6A TaxID=1632865 RepID=UPI0011BAD0BC|nr:hypothetical protein [Pirellula sp. SH-Sr6A]
MNPYEPPTASEVDWRQSEGVLDWLKPARLPFYLLTVVQTIVVVGAYQLWMVGPEVGLTPILEVFWDRVLSILAFAAIFFFLNCCGSQWVEGEVFLNSPGTTAEMRESDRDSTPGRRAQFFPFLSLLLMAIFLISGAIMSSVYRRPHEATWFMLTLTVLVFISIRFATKMRRVRIGNGLRSI